MLHLLQIDHLWYFKIMMTSCRSDHDAKFLFCMHACMDPFKSLILICTASWESIRTDHISRWTWVRSWIMTCTRLKMQCWCYKSDPHSWTSLHGTVEPRELANLLRYPCMIQPLIFSFTLVIMPACLLPSLADLVVGSRCCWILLLSMPHVN
jgi:hypothetical protein